MYFINRLWVKLFGKEVGTDQFGNKYFVGDTVDSVGRNKRYVIYKGKSESSKVPPVWHAWLHYVTDELPNQELLKSYDWQKAHVPNLTGTKYAYAPYNTTKKASCYTKWQPQNK